MSLSGTTFCSLLLLPRSNLPYTLVSTSRQLGKKQEEEEEEEVLDLRLRVLQIEDEDEEEEEDDEGSVSLSRQESTSPSEASTESGSSISGSIGTVSTHCYYSLLRLLLHC